MENPNKSVGILAMAATAILWSIAGLFIKIIDWNPFAIAGVRSLIASIIIFLYLKHPRIHLSFPQIAASIANAATMLLFVWPIKQLPRPTRFCFNIAHRC